MLTKRYTIAARSRFNIWVDQEELPEGSGQRPLADVAVSTVLRSLNGVPIVVERAMCSDAGGVAWAAGTNARATTLR